MIHPFFPLPNPFFSFFIPLLSLPPRSVTGSLPRLFADSATCPPSGSPVIVLRVDIGHWQLETCSKRGLVGGRGCHQEDGELSNRQSENGARSSFHPFVCSQAVFSPVKTKFNLHPFSHCFSLLSIVPQHISQSILCLYLLL